MKTFKKYLAGILFLMVMCAPMAFADGGVTATAPLQFPTWIVAVIKALENLPVMGHAIAVLVIALGVASPILTALTALLMAVEKAFNLTGLAPEINFLNQKLIPFVGYFSNFNVQPPANAATVAAPAPVAPSTPPSA